MVILHNTYINSYFIYKYISLIFISRNRRPVKIALGENNLTPNAYSVRRRDLDIAEIIIHPEYKSSASYNDIALIRLAKKLNLDYGERPAIRPACLAQSDVPVASNVTATGWGRLVALGGIVLNMVNS